MATPLNIDRARLGWWAVGAVLAGTLAFVVHSFIGTFVFGVFLYYATRPVYRRVGRRVRPPSLAAGVALTALALPALLLLVYTLAVALQEAQRVLEGFDNAQIEAILGPYFDISGIVQDPQALLNEPSVRAAIESGLSEALGYVGFIGNGLLHLFVMLGIAFYLLRDDGRLSSWFLRRFSDADGVVDEFLTAVDRDFSRIFFGNIVNAALTGVIGALAYNVLNLFAPGAAAVPYPTLVGLLTGIGSLVPVVGMKVVYFPVAAYMGASAAQADPATLWFPATFAVVSFVIVDAVPDLVLRPWVSGRGMHLGMVMLAYIFGPLLFGWYGIFLGPMLLVLIVHFTKLVLPELVAGTPLQPRAVGDAVGGEGDESVGDREAEETGETEGIEDAEESSGSENRPSGADA
jgi:predicted PurR-regulated permease PerM